MRKKNNLVGHHASKQWIPAEQEFLISIWDPDSHLTADILYIPSLADSPIPCVVHIYGTNCANLQSWNTLHVKLFKSSDKQQTSRGGTFWKHEYHCCLCTRSATSVFGACHGIMVMPISSEQCLCSRILTALGNFSFWRLRYVNLHVFLKSCVWLSSNSWEQWDVRDLWRNWRICVFHGISFRRIIKSVILGPNSNQQMSNRSTWKLSPTKIVSIICETWTESVVPQLKLRDVDTVDTKLTNSNKSTTYLSSLLDICRKAPSLRGLVVTSIPVQELIMNKTKVQELLTK